MKTDDTKGPKKIDNFEKGNIESIYFMGIAGTGMAAVAGLTQEAGYKVLGSDNNVYPPMSTMLEELNIDVLTPYREENLRESNPDLVIVANCLSRGNKEIEALIDSNIPFTSFPKLLGDFFLKERHSIVVTGTHGKTTTSSLIAHMLDDLGENPGYIVGGIPKNFQRSFRLGTGKCFVTEGDEYDTAFFDKASKFLHYQPKTLLFNNLEFDHADIFDSLQDIEKMFKQVISLVTNKGNIICNWDDQNVRKVIEDLGIQEQVTKVSCFGMSKNTDLEIRGIEVKQVSNGLIVWTVNYNSKWWGEFKIETPLSGRHNVANISQMLATIGSLAENQIIKNTTIDDIKNSLKKFKSVKRRLEYIGSVGNKDVYEDFAHHPTAVKMIIDNFKTTFPNRRLVAAFEPKNATSRRNTFEAAYIDVLSGADVVLMGACPEDNRIPKEQQMNTERICSKIGGNAHAFKKNDEILDWLKINSLEKDIIVFMSSGSFSGVQHKIIETLKSSKSEH